MVRLKLILGIALLYSISAISQENAANPFSFTWDNGFRLESKDSLIALEFGGSLFVDHAYFHQDSQLSENYGFLESKSGTELRRARLFFSGTIYGNTHFKLQTDFSGDEVTVKDAYIGISDIPVFGNLLIGHFKEPFRLSALTSSKYFTLMEGGANSYFFQSRNNGAMIFNDFLNNNLSAQFGAFRNADNNSNDVLANDGYALTGRVTGIPFRDSPKRRLLHFGVGYSFRKPDSREYRISISPGSHLAENYLNTGTIEIVNNVGLMNLETAYVHGPFSIQAEYLSASVNTVGYRYHFSNYYAELSYFITGESKNFKSSYDGFGRVKPNSNFGISQNGPGAWEVALRYSKTDLNDQLIVGGKQSELTFGINWYLNSASRFMINYVRANIEDKGNLNIIQGRLQIDF